jgi:hypothetical protein
MNSVLSQHTLSLETINLSMIYETYLYGACLVLLDGLAVISPLNSTQLKQESVQFLLSTLTIFSLMIFICENE